MALEKLKTRLSIEDYLAGEELSDIRHEFLGGEVFAMAGASARHNAITGNIFGNLWTHMRDSACETYKENMKLKFDADTFYYPDVMVACDEKPESEYYREQPIFVVEVVSPSTEQTDRREKLRTYQQIPSVVEYAIVDQDKINMQLHRRQPDGRWLTHFYNESDMDVNIEFRSVGLEITLEEIYRRVKF